MPSPYKNPNAANVSSRMILENVRFGEHCRIWHQSCHDDSMDSSSTWFDRDRFTPAFSAPPQPAATPTSTVQFRQWQNRNRFQSNRLIGGATPMSGISSALGYPLQPAQFSQKSDRHRGQCLQNTHSWSIDSNRYQKSMTGSSTSASSTGFPPRKTLLDTFVDRNDDYWKNRVTIKIDVAFTDHSHVIGKSGRNTQLIMKDTGCHIHFPDANRNPDMEKSNMVTIAGPMQSVDKARRAIRDLAPLVITLEMKDHFEDVTVMAEDPVMRDISVIYGLNALVRTNRSSGQPFFVVRGSVHQSNAIREAILLLQQRFLNTTTATCSLSLDVLQPQQPIVIGPSGAHMDWVSNRTCAEIHYPRSNSSTATTFFIRGTIDAILAARRHILGLLPMSFAFEVQKEDAASADIDEMAKEYGLSVVTRASRHDESMMVVVKGQERQATQMYAMRHRIVGGMLPDEAPVIANDFDFMKDFTSSTIVEPSPNLDMNDAASVSFNGASNSNVFTFATPYVLPYSPISAPWFANNSGHFFNFTAPNMNNSISTASSSFTHLSIDSVTDLEANSASDTPISSRAKIIASTSFDPVPEEAPLASGILEAAKKIQATERRSKAPGAERSISFDYDKQQILAAKAMRDHPRGPRVPTDHWSGLGFSRSMPMAVIAAKMKEAADLPEKTQNGHLENGFSKMAGMEVENGKIDPWEMGPKPKKVFNSTTYFECGGVSIDLNLSDNGDVSMLLTQLHLVKYVDIFREQEVDMGTFLTMTDADLKELGVNTFGARRKLLVLISELKEYHRRRGE